MQVHLPFNCPLQDMLYMEDVQLPKIEIGSVNSQIVTKTFFFFFSKSYIFSSAAPCLVAPLLFWFAIEARLSHFWQKK